MPTPWRLRIFIRESAFSAVAFTAAIYLYFLTANWGVQNYLAEGPLKDYLSHPAVHVENVMAGVMFGVLLGLVNWFTERVWVTSRSFGLVVLVRSALYVAGLGFVFVAVAAFFIVTRILPLDALRETVAAFSPRYLFSVVLWLAVVGTGINFLLEIRRMVGQGNLWRLLTGHYRRPRDEERVFLFMDLVGSTGAAEQLGHERYSQFIQACFRDLTGVALESGGTIYQYVGDEVVMTWPAGGEGARMRSVQAFFDYERSLAERGPWYQGQFGMVPVFRGGIDVGSVIATEIGELKRDIAYHGDVINTASRLLDLCKEREGRLMVSERVGDQVMEDASVMVEWQDEVRMKGKESATRVFSLEPGEKAAAGN